jgi:hypothetical protein
MPFFFTAQVMNGQPAPVLNSLLQPPHLLLPSV